jgi:hypothetical protein
VATFAATTMLEPAMAAVRTVALEPSEELVLAPSATPAGAPPGRSSLNASRSPTMFVTLQVTVSEPPT